MTTGSGVLLSQFYLKSLQLRTRAQDCCHCEMGKRGIPFCPGGQGHPKGIGALLSSHLGLRVVERWQSHLGWKGFQGGSGTREEAEA